MAPTASFTKQDFALQGPSAPQTTAFPQRPSHLLSAANRCRSWTEEALETIFCPLLCSLLGVSLGVGGGSWSPAASGQWWGWACSSPSTFSGWQKGPGPHLATREPLQQLSGKATPAKVTKVIRGSKGPKGQVKDPGNDEAPRIQSPSSVLTVLGADGVPRRPVHTPFRPRAPLILHPHLSSCSPVSSAAGNGCHPAPLLLPGLWATSRLFHPERAPLPLPARAHCPLRAPGSTFPGLCGLRQSADYCSMLETSLHSPRHSRIIRNTCATLTRTPQGRSCFSRAPVLLVPRCDGRHALRAHERPLKSLPPSASWYGLWLTLKQGQGVF